MIYQILHYSPYFCGPITLIIFLLTKDKKLQIRMIQIGGIQIGNVVLSFILKEIFNFPRPNSIESGFPSSHSMFWQGLLTLSIKFEQKVYIIVCLIFEILVCFQRYYDNYHYLYQIFGGIVIGHIYCILAYYIVEFHEQQLPKFILKMYNQIFKK